MIVFRSELENKNSMKENKLTRITDIQRRISEHLEDMAYAYQQDAEFLDMLTNELQIALDDYLDDTNTIRLLVNR